MVDFDKFLEFIQKQDYYVGQIAHIEQLPKRDAEFGKLKKPLRKRLQRWLDNNNIILWGHQAKAINHIKAGHNIVVTTSTASGKSLIYNISVLSQILKDPNSTAIYIFPTKALARDQLGILKNLLSETNIKESRIGAYDGDIESHDKREVLANANVIITNPYGINFYLPWFKRKWGRICQNLKYIVLDEIHIYQGIFGSNFALLLRRLKRILDIYNVKPQWILSSATISNPKEFAERLVGEEFQVVNKDDSPMAPKRVILWDLPYDEVSKKYRSAHQETKNLYISHLRFGLQTLTFTLSRKMAELQAIWTKSALPKLSEQIVSYRAGIRKSTRRMIEQGFKNREILGISSTNALELGIDIGSLDATISSGFPGTISSFQQQIGRSGRGKDLSISTFIPMQNPLDFFYIHNPSILFGPIQEQVLITLKNKSILKNHLCCAAKENPIKVDEYKKFGVETKSLFKDLLGELIEEKLLMKRSGRYIWKGGFYPNEKYGLNSLSDRSYKVVLRAGTFTSLLTIEDESFVFRDLHEGAVFLYEAETYLVVEQDFQQKIVYVSKANVDYYTQSLKHTDITQMEVISEKLVGPGKNIEVSFGNVKVEHQYYSYKVIDTITQEIRSRHSLEDLPLIEFETQAVWFTIPFEVQKELEMKGYDLGGTVHAFEHAMIAMAPALAQISRWDLGGVSIDFDPIKQKPIIYIYDAYRGGIGIAESLFDKLIDLLTLTYLLIRSCSCKTENGCPACVMSPKCGNNNEPLDKQGALFILKKLLEIKKEKEV
ncbi:MAG: DEAD/DEAH box helicase [Promethearchaeota archaeon]